MGDDSKNINLQGIDINMLVQCFREDIIPLFEKAVMGDFTEYRNEHIPMCYEVMSCSNIQCPVFGSEPQRCWQVVGTYCGGDPQGSFVEKYHSCKQCEVFKQSTPTIIEEVGENLNNMLFLLNKHRQEINNNYEYIKMLNEEIKSNQEQLIQSEKMASLGILTAGIAHEINNPLSFVHNNVITIQKYTNETLNLQKIYDRHETSSVLKLEVDAYKRQIDYDYIVGRKDKLFEATKNGITRIMKIVQNLKEFSRLDSAEVAEIEINGALDTTVDMIHFEYKNRIEIHKNYGDIPTVLCVGAQINQVLMNLLINACQAIEGSGIITIGTHADNGVVNIEISDTGKGIPKEIQNKIFDPFFTTKPVGVGTGLGLSICYKIVKEHKGSIELESTPGIGTTFRIKIPVEFGKDFEGGADK
ncbi:MAG: histidine kinase [Nitrospirae bacterium]|nr:histidine kinase [Nitrospirota bacterium]